MEAPEKLYFNTSDINGILNIYSNKDPHDSLEYIRKDALIEWAKNMKRICQGAEPLEKAYQTIIDKLRNDYIN